MLLLPILILCVALAAMTVVMIRDRKEAIVFSEDYIMAEELAPLFSFTYYDTEEWTERISEIASGKLTYRELSRLLKELGVQEYIEYESGMGFQTVTREEFFRIYAQIVDLLDVKERVSYEERLFIQEKDVQVWFTQMGTETVSGGLQYINPYDMYGVYTVDGQICGLVCRLDTPLMWENVFIHTSGDGQAKLLFEHELLTIQVPALEQNIQDTICSLEWQNGAVTAIYKKEETISGTVLSYNDSQIEISSYGALQHSGELKIYKTYGTVEQLDESKLVIGNLVADFVVARKEVCGIILKEPAHLEQIRVLLLNGSTPYYPDIYIMAQEDATVIFGEQQQTLASNTLLRASDYWQEGYEGYIRVDTASGGDSLFLANENGEVISLAYGGSFEVRRYAEGYCVVNELSLEDYLCGVVPSEMPASYETEALRAQAVCARSYACIQLANSDYAGFGANVDDSTNYQVYNKQVKDERATLAVQDTVGEVLKYRGEIAEAYYYSTSCGVSQDAGVWDMAGDEAYGYLGCVSLLEDGATADLSDEQAFSEFIQNGEIVAYDSDAPLFRWRAQLDTVGLLSALNQAAVERRALSGDYVQFLDNDGNAWDSALSGLGSITGIQVVARNLGGDIEKLQIFYERGSILISTEYNIRRILSAAITSIKDKNGNAVTATSLLPSTAFTIIPVEQGFVLYGGGYGHGLGMSQNGANGMAKAGFSYTDILQAFYQNITIENIYNSQNID